MHKKIPQKVMVMVVLFFVVCRVLLVCFYCFLVGF